MSKRSTGWLTTIGLALVHLCVPLAAEEPKTATQLLAEKGIDTSNAGLRQAAEGHADHRIRIMAAVELSGRGFVEAAPTIARLFAAEREEWARILLADALAHLGDSRGEAFLKRLCDSSTDASVRYDAADRLLRLRSAYGLKAVIELARSEGAVREAALMKLVDFASLPALDVHKQIVPVLSGALSAPSARKAASQALALLGDPAGLSPLEAAVAAEQDTGRREFMEAQLRILRSRQGPS